MFAERIGLAGFSPFMLSTWRQGKVVNQSWEVKWRNCPNNGFNQPLRSMTGEAYRTQEGLQLKISTRIDHQKMDTQIISNIG